ncbi:GABA transporter 1 [Vitis vinifera]|uniref:GABA transporter 1 n=1 Tax=Vitis vinifera TaxID=29760 RepID=A0A438CRP3_VITVI|nr:GABA transporter 1 [Vitis vinifera]
MGVESNFEVEMEVHVCPQLEMATVLPTTMDVSTIAVDTPINPPKDLDAGALLVLKSKVAPVLLSLPYAMGLLGWVAGVVWLALAALVTFYSYNLLSLGLDGEDISWAAPICDMLWCSYCLFSSWRQSLKAKWWHAALPVYYNVWSATVVLGTNSILPFPKAHQPRLSSPLSCLQRLAQQPGSSSKAPPKDYSLSDDRANRLFGAFNGISIIATTYASGIIPEIQATIAPPVTGKMFKGLCICYTVIILTYFSVGISGYWAFGNDAQGSVLSNFIDGDNPLLPTWFLLMTNVFTLTQLAAVGVVYLQPTNEVLEGFFANPKKDPFSLRNTIPRLISVGCIPLDFILPMIFYNVSFKPSKKSLVFWINTTIAVVSSALAAVGAVSSVRQMVLDTKTYHLFANV